MAYASRSGKTDRRTWTPLRFEADEADFNITLPTIDDKSSCPGTITSITSMTGRLPRCSQHESPSESGGPSRRSGAEVCPLPTRIDFVVPDALGTTIKSTSMASWRYTLAWRRRATAAGRCCDLYMRPAVVRCLELCCSPSRAFQSSDRLPLATVWRGPGARLRNVNAAGGALSACRHAVGESGRVIGRLVSCGRAARSTKSGCFSPAARSTVLMCRRRAGWAGVLAHCGRPFYWGFSAEPGVQMPVPRA
jgi:hypothetical protein